MKIIKLENIIDEGFDRQTGKTVSKATTEYVCENCRHLIEVSDKFCWQCGERLEQSNFVEYYSKGGKITKEEYQKGGEQCYEIK